MALALLLVAVRIVVDQRGSTHLGEAVPGLVPLLVGSTLYLANDSTRPAARGRRRDRLQRRTGPSRPRPRDPGGRRLDPAVHTQAEPNASTRVLQRCGFRRAPELDDAGSDDTERVGVWAWRLEPEQVRATAAAPLP